MQHHYTTQPLPTPLAPLLLWLIPSLIHRFSSFISIFIEVVLPFFIILPQNILYTISVASQCLFQVFFFFFFNFEKKNLQWMILVYEKKNWKHFNFEYYLIIYSQMKCVDVNQNLHYWCWCFQMLSFHELLWKCINQLAIIATGNFGFFNWLTIGLCVICINDETVINFLSWILNENYVSTLSLFSIKDSQAIFHQGWFATQVEYFAIYIFAVRSIYWKKKRESCDRCY